MYLNKVILYGNLTRDPELKALPSGSQVAEFGIATNRTYKDKDGSKKEEVDFHNIVAFGRTAEVIKQYLVKGRPIFIEGRIRTRSWEAKDGTGKRYKTEIVLENFQFGPSAGPRNGTEQERGSGTEQKNPSAPSSESGGAGIQYPEEQINAEDIPF